MSRAAATRQKDALRFGDNEVRLEIVCNSLRAYVDDNQGVVGTTEEADLLATFFESELPEIMHQIAVILTAAIRARGNLDHEVTAALDIMREDQERLASLVGNVIDRLRSVARSPDQADHTALRQAISSYLVALRSHMDWSRKIILEKSS